MWSLFEKGTLQQQLLSPPFRRFTALVGRIWCHLCVVIHTRALAKEMLAAIWDDSQRSCPSSRTKGESPSVAEAPPSSLTHRVQVTTRLFFLIILEPLLALNPCDISFFFFSYQSKNVAVQSYYEQLTSHFASEKTSMFVIEALAF